MVEELRSSDPINSLARKCHVDRCLRAGRHELVVNHGESAKRVSVDKTRTTMRAESTLL
jgi:hypothetical protein